MPDCLSAVPVSADREALGIGPQGRVAIGILALFAVLQIYLAFVLNINWDEYYFLSQIYESRAGRLANPMQTFHVELLPWLASLPLSEPDQIVAGRLLMILCQAGSLACLYAIGRALFPTDAVLLALAAYATSGWVLGHGASFRTDPLAAFLMLASLALLFRSNRWPPTVIAGLLASIGLLVTIKSALYLPVFAGAFLWRCKEDGLSKAAKLFLLAGVSLVIAGAAGWLVHSANIHAPVQAAAEVPRRATGIFDMLIGSQPWFPRWPYVRLWLTMSAVPVALMTLGLIADARQFRAGFGIRPWVVVLFVAPILSLAFYRNAFPYFFPFIFAPASLAIAASARFLTPLVQYAVLAVMGFSLAAQAATLVGRDQSAQRQVAQVAHQIFPEPVPYIDRNGMLPSFPKVGYFMSSWGVEVHIAQGVPTLLPVMEKRRPPLIIANSPQLEAAFGLPVSTEGRNLVSGDVQALRSNYVHHWGPLWVAGKALMVEPAGRTFEILIPGPYTLECSGSVSIDGRPLSCGSVQFFNEGQHVAARASQRLVLRWGSHLPRPAASPPEKPIYYGF